MQININELKIKIKKATGENKHPNLLAYASLIFSCETGEYFTISGFTIWLSKFGGFNVEVPKNRKFQYCLFEKALWRKIKIKIIKQFEELDTYENIPVVEDER